jgi:hypothetical protein
MDYRSFAMATEYHVVTLPNKSKVPVRDHYLREGRPFSITGEVKAEGVIFDGTEGVELHATIDEEVMVITDQEIDEIMDTEPPEF